jgi:PAS domain S-box-containing protein
MKTILIMHYGSPPPDSLVHTLSAEDYRVRVAENGDMAIATAVAERPDLIVASAQLPDMSLLEFCCRLKSTKETASIPLLVVTTGSNDNAVAHSGIYFVTEPRDVIAHIRRHLQVSGPHVHHEASTGRSMQFTTAIVQLDREIACRNDADESLQWGEERFRMMANTAPVLMWVAGPDRKCTFFNDTWLEFTGRTMDQEVGNGWTDNVHPDDRDRCISTYEASFDARLAFRMEYRLRRRDGEYRWMLDGGAPLIESSGDFGGYVGSCIDITDVKQAQYWESERRRLENLQMLAGGVAHDFTNLMGTILTTAEVAELEIADGSLPKQEIETIRTIATRAVEMARELMNHERTGERDIQLLNVSRIVEDMADILKNRIGKRCVLSMHLPKSLPRIWGNATKIRQIVMNLIINAAEAIDENSGTIRIRISRATGDFTDRGILPQGDYLRLEISDTGCGMTDEQRRRIFEPFYTTKGRGNGLGLTVVQKIVQSFGGAIHVISAAGQGTRFEVFLPCVDEVSAASAACGVTRGSL